MKVAEPKSVSERAAYSKRLDQTSDREQARRDRLHVAEGIIPSSIWIVLLLISGVVFAFMRFFADSGEGVGAQAMLMGSATTVIVLTPAAINALNNQYRHGPGQIKAVAMERSLRMLGTARAVVGATAPVPCDARGAPVASLCSIVIRSPPRRLPGQVRAGPGAHPACVRVCRLRMTTLTAATHKGKARISVSV